MTCERKKKGTRLMNAEEKKKAKEQTTSAKYPVPDQVRECTECTHDVLCKKHAYLAKKPSMFDSDDGEVKQREHPDVRVVNPTPKGRELPDHPLCQHEHTAQKLISELLRLRKREVALQKEMQKVSGMLDAYEAAAEMVVRLHGPFVIDGYICRTMEGGMLHIQRQESHTNFKVTWNEVPHKNVGSNSMKVTPW